MNSLMEDIPQFTEWNRIEKVNLGWSDDEKYYIEANSGQQLLLRISSIDQYDSKKKEFVIIKKFNQLDFVMSRAIDFGTCNHNKNAYMLLSWVDGISLESVIQDLSIEEQYKLGIMAGKILQSIHNLPVDEDDLPKITKIAKKINQLERYEKSKYRVANDEKAIQYVKENIPIICQSKPAYEHVF